MFLQIPTGMLHIGHARGAVLGDAISSILQEVGHDVDKEYYINDAGEQIKKLVKTIIYHKENPNSDLKKLIMMIIIQELFSWNFVNNKQS